MTRVRRLRTTTAVVVIVALCFWFYGLAPTAAFNREPYPTADTSPIPTSEPSNSASQIPPRTPTPTPTSAIGIDEAPGQMPDPKPGNVRVSPLVMPETYEADNINGLAAPAQPDMVGLVEGAAANHGANVQVSWFDPEQGIVTAGRLDNGNAWSTIKVPIALAALNNDASDYNQQLVASSIQYSDNAAAEELFITLGSTTAERADAVTTVLRSAGDTVTKVAGSEDHRPWNGYGWTEWTTHGQVQFAVVMPELENSNVVMDHMSNIVPEQSWGMGTLPNASFKGGWGPNPEGNEAARQFGWYETDRGRVVVAVAVTSPSQGQTHAALTEVADGLEPES